MDFSQNVAFIEKIDKCVKEVRRDGKLDKNDIPTIVLLVTDLIMTANTGVKTSPTTEQIAASIDSLYNYIMSRYNLFPEDEQQKTDLEIMQNSNKIHVFLWGLSSIIVISMVVMIKNKQ